MMCYTTSRVGRNGKNKKRTLGIEKERRKRADKAQTSALYA